MHDENNQAADLEEEEEEEKGMDAHNASHETEGLLDPGDWSVAAQLNGYWSDESDVPQEG